ncbi:hypothetical protein [Pseudocitrobacter vendiensis]|uniref:Uncharacterized protein n=1 Tax=Pseudocitrobacter vendiensis TaxID=2488306 RepID=A0ABM9F4J1_9ENTR|nr:hypothetical protein [Pseudocitrobacter vendiensis]CAH6635650.1 hypothetical protein FBBNIHIM_02325 [Pseudocitrobacter vendiensis]
MLLKQGVVSSGEYVGWELQVVDDTNGETGGFYLVLRNDIEVFDYWFEKKEFLENQLADFDVHWKT